MDSVSGTWKKDQNLSKKRKDTKKEKRGKTREKGKKDDRE